MTDDEVGNLVKTRVKLESAKLVFMQLRAEMKRLHIHIDHLDNQLRIALQELDA